MIRTKFSIFASIRRGCLAMWRDQDGIAALVVAIFVPVLVAVTALAVDMSYAYWTRTQLQHTATAAALAGASQLNDPVDAEAAVKAEAIVYANLNMDPTRFGTTLVDIDVTVGNWDPDCAAIAVGPAARADCFTPMGETGGPGNACDNPVPQETNENCLIIDAVQATTRMAQANNNPLNLFLASVLGLAQTDINTSAIAWSQGGAVEAESNCYQNGLLAGNMASIQSTNTFTNDFCVYGHCGILVNQNNVFSNGAQVAIGPVDAAWCATLPPYLDATPGENCDQVTGLDCLYDVYEGNYEAPGLEPELALDWAANLYPSIQFSEAPVLPDLAHPIQAVDLAPWESMMPGTWNNDTWKDAPPCTSSGAITTYYILPIVSETANITGPSSVCDVAIIADTITIGAGSQLDNVLLISREVNAPDDINPDMYPDSFIDIGGPVTMNNVVLVSRGDINIGSDSTLGNQLCDANDTSIQIFAMRDVNLQSNTDISNAEIAAAHDVNLGSANSVNLSGSGATIQAVNDVTVQSDGTFGACTPEEGGGGGEGEGGGGDIVGTNNRVVD